MATRLMSDSASGAAPAGVELVAAYATGYPGSQVAFRAHPGIPHVLIVQRNSLVRANVCDVERGAATPAFAASWARYMRTTRQNLHPAVYVSESAQGSVAAAFNAIREPLPLWWIASWGTPAGSLLTAHIDPGPGDVVAHQYANDVAHAYDLSAVVRYWPGVDPIPYVTPSPLMTHAQWVWIRYAFIPDHYAEADRAHAWTVLSSDPAKARALAGKYMPAG